jgi:3-methyl-2-oxobutanoate hydroxymethyltransferase
MALFKVGSASKTARRLTAPDIKALKRATPIVMLTAYSTRMAELLDPHCEVLLVGDSVAQVIYGFPSTLPVTLDMMIAHGSAVVRGSSSSLVVIDMPFGSYEESPVQAFRSASRVMQETGAGAIKLEGGKTMAPTIEFLSQRGIPVMAHIGLTPQSVNALGGYGVRGRGNADYSRIFEDGEAVAKAGAFSVVIEAVVEPLARSITDAIDCPTIGIGASDKCDGQVLVVDDMLGMFERSPGFVKKLDNIADRVSAAAAQYSREVRSRAFPDASHLTGVAAPP